MGAKIYKKEKPKVYKEKKPKVYKEEEPEIYKKYKVYKSIFFDKDKKKIKKLNYPDIISRINEILSGRNFINKGELDYLKIQRDFYIKKQKEEKFGGGEINNSFKLK